MLRISGVVLFCSGQVSRFIVSRMATSAGISMVYSDVQETYMFYYAKKHKSKLCRILASARWGDHVQSTSWLGSVHCTTFLDV